MADRLPEDLEAERSLLATLCAAGNEAKAAEIGYTLDPEVFIHPGHRAVFLALLEVVKEPGAEVNAVVLKDALARRGQLAKIGDYTGLIELLSAEEVSQPERLAAVLTRLHLSRQLIRIGATLARDAQDRREEPGELLNHAANALAILGSAGGTRGIRGFSEILPMAESGRPFRDGHGGKLAWFGLDPIDEALEAAAGQIIIAAARPGVGKTAAAVQGILETARQGGRPLFICLEMSAEEIFARAAASLTMGSSRSFRHGDYGTERAGQLWHSRDILDGAFIWTPEKGSASWQEIEAVIRHAQRVHGITSVWIDYFTLIQKPKGTQSQTDASRYAELMGSIRRCTKQLGICTILLSQLRKENAGVEPTDADLRDTGQLEQDAYAILMLWFKDQKAQEEQALEREVWIKVAKNRQGPAGFKRLLSVNGSINRLAIVERNTMEAAACAPQGKRWIG